MRRYLVYDVETRSTADLKQVGSHIYTSDPTTDFWCVSYCTVTDGERGPIATWLPSDPVPAEILTAAADPGTLVVAFNNAFEHLVEERILHPRYGWPIFPLERRRCAMTMALASALPGSLEGAAEALGLPVRKDVEGARLMRSMSRPRKPRRGEDPANIYWHDDPEKLERLYAYCRNDVEVEHQLFERLAPLIADEQLLWRLDATINARGFHTDGALLEAASKIAAAAGQAAQDELARITDGALTSTDQVAALPAWLAQRGCEVKDVRKSTLRAALRREDLDPTARRVIELRLGAAHAAAAKVDTLLAWRGADGRVRGSLKFHGAATGRWTGHGPQPQNFKRDSDGVESKCEAIATGDLMHVAKFHPQPLEAVGDIARAMICAAPGHRLIIGDFSGIESRVLAWVSSQHSKLEQWAKFDRTGDPKDEPYYLLGRACGLPEKTARAIGKTADLAFGYMGGPGAWDRLAGEEDASSEEDKRRYQRTWRGMYPQTVLFWGGINRAALNAVRKPNTTFTYKRLTLSCDGTFLRIVLPSGRSLVYPFPRLATDKFENAMVVFKDNAAGKWTDCRFGQGAYGGLWTENIVQAIARDLLAAAMLRLEAAGYPITLHVHDEIVAEVPDGFGSVEEFQHILTALPDWAEGLPIAAKVRNGPRFCKTETKEPTTTPSSAKAENADAKLEDCAADARPSWATPALTEVPPSTAEFEAILVSLLEKDCAFVPPSEAPRSNGHDRSGEEHDQHNGGRDGYPRGERDTGRQVAFFVYRQADGQPYLGVKKTSSKQFPQHHWTGSGWAKGAPKGPKIPYRLPELIKVPLDAWVLICAGEKDADTASALGFAATTNPEGERKGAWAPELNAWFAGRKRVAIMEDNDATGRAHAIEVADALRGVVPDIRIVTFRDLPEQGDLTDWKERGFGRDDLVAKIEATKPYRPKPRPSPIRQWDDEPVPELEYAVPDRYPLENVGLLSGEGGQGKSSLVQQLCVAHVLEREWLGSVPRRGPAVYVECEDAENVLHWRLKAIAAHYGVSLAAIADAGFQIYPLADEENAVLATAPDKSGIVRPTPLYDWLYELAGDVKPVMIGIASSANVFAGNENVRTEVQQFIRLLRRIACVAHGTVLLVTQPSLTGIENKSASHEGLAGTTQWHNAVRARAVMKAVKPEDGIDTGLRAITFHKNQYGPASATCFVRYEGGLFLPVDGMSMDAAERAAKADEVFVALLKRFTAQKQTVSPKPSSAYAPSRFAGHPEAGDITRKEFAAAMQRLLDAKVIEIRTWGRPSRQTHYLALAGED